MDLTYLFLTFFKNILKYKSLENKNPKNNKYDVSLNIVTQYKIFWVFLVLQKKSYPIPQFKYLLTFELNFTCFTYLPPIISFIGS